MNRKAIYTRVFIITVFFLAAFFSASAQIRLEQHVVKGGETLYRLSVQYGVTVSQILKYNPGLNNGNIKIGNTVLIPILKDGNTKESFREQHKIKRRETLYSISRQYGITIDELKAANPEMFAANYKLKKGKIINIPYPSSANKSKEKTATEVAPKVKEVAKTPTVSRRNSVPVKIAIMLPFASDAAGSNRCIEFYRGFLLAVEKMQAEGQCVEIYAYNEPHAKSSIITILEKIRLNRVNLLVGPLYFDHFAAVSRFSKVNEIKTLIPFSSKAEEVSENPYIFLLNAPEKEKHVLASNLFIKNFENFKAIFMVSDSRSERTFTSHLRSKLIEEGVEIADVAIASTNQQIQEACNPEKNNIFIPDGSSNSDFEHIMARLLHFKNDCPNLKTAFFAYPEWQKFAYTRRSDMHVLDTYIFTNAFYNPWSATTNELKKEYERWFKSEIIATTPVMFMLGYDTGLTFINGLSAYGRRFSTQDQKLPLQQSDIVFRRVSDNGGYINSSMWFIHYRKDYEIEKVSEQ